MSDKLQQSWMVVVLPVCLGLGVAATLTSAGGNFFNKMLLFANGAAVFCLSRDFSWPKQADPAEVTEVSGVVRVIFVRHGESVWNEVFNKGINLGFFARLTRAVLTEISLLCTPDSVFFDSPLSAEGIAQAKGLSEYLLTAKGNTERETKGIELIRSSGDSIIVVSSMRRAMQTCILGLWGRLQKQGERVVVLTSLQEISRNVDCYPLAGVNSLPPLGNTHSIISTSESRVSKVFDITQYEGAKSLSSNGLIRMRSFADWASRQPSPCVVVVGHSLWFRSFFQTFLPRASTHISKKRKIDNCGVVMFDLEVGNLRGSMGYRIAEDSITPLYRGFQ